MLRPPLSYIPNELLDKVVDELAQEVDGLNHLSVADRAFTVPCQRTLFQALRLFGTQEDAQERLLELQDLLEVNPLLITHFRSVDLSLDESRCASPDPTWLFHDPTFISVVLSLGASPLPPDTFKVDGSCSPSIFSNPTLSVGRLLQSFFSSSLTSLIIRNCLDLPASLFLVSLNLKRLELESTDLAHGCKLSESPCYGRDPPQLDTIAFTRSPAVIKRLTRPIQTGKGHLVDWSRLRSLRVSSQDQQCMPLVQHILDSTHNTIEVIDFTLSVPSLYERYRPLATLISLQSLSRLSVLSMRATIDDKYRMDTGMVQDIDAVLSSLPHPNLLQHLSLEFTIQGFYPWSASRGQPWGQLGRTLARIPSGTGQVLKLDFDCEVQGWSMCNVPKKPELVHNLLREEMSVLWTTPSIFLRFNTSPTPQELAEMLQEAEEARHALHHGFPLIFTTNLSSLLSINRATQRHPMLNPPLSEVPNELLCHFVNELDQIGGRMKDIPALSVVDRAFTSLCQKILFQSLSLFGGKRDAQKRLLELQRLLDASPSLAGNFRCINLRLDGPRSDPSWIYDDPAFISVVLTLGTLPSPPSTLIVDGDLYPPSLFHNPDLAIGRLVQSFISSSLPNLTIRGNREARENEPLIQARTRILDNLYGEYLTTLKPSDRYLAPRHRFLDSVPNVWPTIRKPFDMTVGPEDFQFVVDQFSELVSQHQSTLKEKVIKTISPSPGDSDDPWSLAKHVFRCEHAVNHIERRTVLDGEHRC
ncbi:hypothetical protein BKA70DRAFT_1463415 [Coprinopsis sp. MPI-PUGE-AT-0042]|nr:hypothetical protein BKA70DRAFT_1463415 [Coprinopsis sp. MPI-PUGE-AT-0042]